MAGQSVANYSRTGCGVDLYTCVLDDILELVAIHPKNFTTKIGSILDNRWDDNYQLITRIKMDNVICACKKDVEWMADEKKM